MSRRAWRATVLGRVVSLLQRGTPRLETYYGRLPEAAGVAPGSSLADHERRLLRYYGELADRVTDLPDVPTISLIVTGRPHPQLRQTLASIGLQVNPRWQLLVTHLPGDGLDPAVERFTAGFPGRCTVVPVTEGDELESALRHVECEFVGSIEPGERLYPSALGELARAIALERERSGGLPDVVYSDERMVDDSGTPVGDPVFKPGWSPVLLRGGNYLGSLTLFRRASLAAAGGFGMAPDAVHNAALRVTPSGSVLHVPHVLTQRRQGTAALRVKPLPRPDPVPSVSIVIPTRDRGELLRRCLDSVERSRDPFELVVVDNGTTEPVALDVLADAEGRGARILPHPGPFNFGRLCNAGARAASGDVIVFLNNDTRVRSRDWLAVLSAALRQPGVAVAGAQLRYPDGRIQHAGLAGLAEAGPGHLFVARDPHRESPLGLATATREVLAVTGACLAVDAELFRSVGGFDEVFLPNDCGDVDLCLRLRERGFTCLYVADAVLEHAESTSRGRSFVDFERFTLLRRWPDQLLNDPYLNPHLAKTTKYAPDPRFPIPDVPAELFERWLRTGDLGLSAPGGATF